jgi:hypothetical protein
MQGGLEARMQRMTSKSPVAVAREALAIAQAALPKYRAPRAKHRYNVPQLFAILVLRQFFNTDYRGIATYLRDFSDLRSALGLTRVPHYSTLQRAEAWFEKKQPLGPC